MDERQRRQRGNGQHDDGCDMSEQDARWQGGEPPSHQQGQRGDDRQNVGGQLRPRCAEEEECPHSPYQQKAPWLKAGADIVRRAAPGRTEYGDDPRQGAREQQRNEVPPGFTPVVDLGGEAQEVFVHEEEPRELRVANGHQHEPGCDDGEEQQAAGRNVQAGPQAPVALEQGIQHQRDTGQHDADQPLAQYRQGHRCPRHVHPQAIVSRGRAVALGEDESPECHEQEQRQAHVQGIDVGHVDIHQAAGRARRRRTRRLSDRTVCVPDRGRTARRGDRSEHSTVAPSIRAVRRRRTRLPKPSSAAAASRNT